MFTASITHGDDSINSDNTWKVVVGIDDGCNVCYPCRESGSVLSSGSKEDLAQSSSSRCVIEVLISKQSYEVIPVSLSNHAYLTAQLTPLLSVEECRRTIALAEAYTGGSGNGWSTNRHYAVPTTDFPIHHCAPILEWFNGIMKARIVPLITAQLASG